jgi:protein-tyrosine phosphatase
VSRASANTVLPGKIYQRGNFLSWPRRQKERLLSELGVTIVVNMWAKMDADLSWENDTGRIYLQWHTSPSEVPPDADLFVLWLSALLNRGHVVLIHCEAGRGRSVWLSTRLLAQFTGTSRPIAWEAVKIAVPNQDVTATLLADLGVRE